MFFWYDQAIYKKGISARNRLKEIRKNIERGSPVFGVFEQKGNYIFNLAHLPLQSRFQNENGNVQTLGAQKNVPKNEEKNKIVVF